MPVVDLSTYKVALNETSSSTKFDNLVQAVQNSLNALDNANIVPGTPLAVTKLAIGANGQVLTTTAGAVAWGTLASATYGTLLPVAPTDGQEHILVDSTTAATYAWRFRFNSAAVSAFKWELVGGTPQTVEIQTSESTASAAYVDLATVGPSITLAHAGEYLATFSADAVNTGGADNNLGVALKLGAAASSDNDASLGWVRSTFNAIGGARTIRRTAAAADVWKLQYKASVNATSFLRRELHVLPVRIS